MSILRHARPQVKTARRIARPFGEGVFPARVPGNAVSDADHAWAAYELNKDSRDYEVLIPGPAPIRGGAPGPDWDALAGEALAADRLCRGLCC